MRVRGLLTGVWLVNVVWAFALHTRIGRAVAIVGVLSATAALARAFREREPADAPSAALCAFTLLAVGLPALSLLGTPRLSFLVLDGRAWLALAWLLASAAALLSGQGAIGTRQPVSRSRPALLVFAVWAVVFWLLVIGDLGLTAAISHLHRDADLTCHSDPLTTIFTIWKTYPLSQHALLGFRTNQAFEVRTPYASHMQAFLVLIFLWHAGVSAIANLSASTATNTIPLFYILSVLAALAVFVWRSGVVASVDGPYRVLMLFLTIGFVTTTWRFWHDMYMFSSDSPFPLLAAVLLALAAFLIEPVRVTHAAAASAVFGALDPYYGPLLAAAIVCIYSRPSATWQSWRSTNRRIILIACACAAGGLVSYGCTALTIHLKGYTPLSSTWLFRSGLDGDTTYFQSLWQAIVAPCPEVCCWRRTFTDLLLPAFVPIIAWGVLWVSPARISSAVRMAPSFLLLCTPYLFSVILFPQAVSIHPYMYDQFVIMPAAALGAAAALSVAARTDNGPLRWAAVLVVSFALMSNLVGVAQFADRLPH